MNYYENKMLEERESRIFAASIGLFFTTPLFGIIGSVVIGMLIPSASAAAFFGTWALVSLLGIFGIVGGIREKMERRRNQNA
jgi:hypothetical protein